MGGRDYDDRASRINGEEPAPINGAVVLDDVLDFLLRFVCYPTIEASYAHALWVAHTHLMSIWDSTPRIAFLSPEPSSGKTRALEVSELLVPRPVEAINATPAYLFRKVSDPDGLPTILFDEIDTLFGAKAKEHEEIRGILNAGHRRGAVAGRCVIKGKTVETEELPAYCAVALAGLGSLPDTILTRSVIIRMRRRAPQETVEPFRRRVHAPEGHALRDRLAAWAGQVRSILAGCWPEMPPGVVDRDADVWEAPLMVADAAGAHWPNRARVAAVTLVTAAKAASPSLGVRLLSDLRDIFWDGVVLAEGLSTNTILERLIVIQESPWADLKGKPLDARKLALLLQPYDVRSAPIRVGATVVKGYKRESLHDPWARYLGDATKKSVTSVTSLTSGAGTGTTESSVCADKSPPVGGLRG